jgi:hypothetical protein
MENIFISSDESSYDIDTNKSISESNRTSTSYVASANDSEANEVYSNMIGGAQAQTQQTTAKPILDKEAQAALKKTGQDIKKASEVVADQAKQKLEEGIQQVNKINQTKHDELVRGLNVYPCDYIKYFLTHTSLNFFTGVGVKMMLEQMQTDFNLDGRGNEGKIKQKWLKSKQGQGVGEGEVEQEVLQVGGNPFNIEPKKYRRYYEKYLKYKLKYLEIKYE